MSYVISLCHPIVLVVIPNSLIDASPGLFCSDNSARLNRRVSYKFNILNFILLKKQQLSSNEPSYTR